MGIFAEELGLYVIRPTLNILGAYSPTAQQLLIGTAAVESDLGSHLHPQERDGLGIYNISAETHRQVWDNYLVHYPDLASSVRGLASQRTFLQNPHDELVTNLAYATAIAWFAYLHAGANISDIQPDDTESLAQVWWRYYRPSQVGPTTFINHCPHAIAA